MSIENDNLLIEQVKVSETNYRHLNQYYSYVYNNPVNLTDPSGLIACGGGGCNMVACLNACALGIPFRRAFCGAILEPRLRAACWSIEFFSEVACNGWCYWNCS